MTNTAAAADQRRHRGQRALMGALILSLAACVPPAPPPGQPPAATAPAPHRAGTATAAAPTPRRSAAETATSATPHRGATTTTAPTSTAAAVTPLATGAPDAPPRTATTPPAVTLLWREAVDLDLYVTGPDAIAVYFARPRGGIGTLLDDTTCATRPAGSVASERVDLGTLPPGNYRIGVDFSHACDGAPPAATFRVVADVGTHRYETTGSMVAQEFRAAALEFTVPADGSLRP